MAISTKYGTLEAFWITSSDRQNKPFFVARIGFVFERKGFGRFGLNSLDGDAYGYDGILYRVNDLATGYRFSEDGKTPSAAIESADAVMQKQGLAKFIKARKKQTLPFPSEDPMDFWLTGDWFYPCTDGKQ